MPSNEEYLNNVEKYLPTTTGNIQDVIEYNKSNGWPDLPSQTKVFAHEFAVVGSLGKACAKVGLSKDRGSRLLRDPLVSSFIGNIMEGLSQDSLITRAFLELQMLETLEQLNGDVEVPHVTKDGIIIMAKSYNGTAKANLLLKMATMTGMDKQRGLNGIGVVINFDLQAAGYCPTFEVISEQ